MTHRLRAIIALFSILCCTMLSAQDDAIIMRIDGDPVTKGEFESIYKKNNRDADVTPAALDEYAELFTNFKLKVKEAERLKMDTASQFINELKGYRAQLARPYLIDTELTESLIREAYDRMTEEVKASHILIKLPPEPSPADTLAAWKKAQEIRKEVKKNPAAFAKVAKTKSDDLSARTNDGMLGYFTSLQMVYPFESAAYNTPVGEISPLVRTRFGYHILKIHDRRDARGEIKVGHIMIKSKSEDDESKKKAASEKIQELYRELESGAKFEGLTAKYSDDKTTAKKGGELPWFGTGKMVPEFEDAAFALANDGDFSAPVLTDYGWHIIKRIEVKPVASYDEKKKELKNRIQKDSRAEMSQSSFINKMKKEYGFTQSEKSLDKVISSIDTTLLVGTWRPASLSKFKKELFTIGDRMVTQGEFMEHLKSTQARTKEKDLGNFVRERYQDYVNKEIIAYEDARLEKKHPEFKALMKEYRDGILLFELTDEMVWNKAIKDTTGLKAYYEEHRDDFKYGERVKGAVYAAKDKTIAQQVRSMVNQGMTNDRIEAEVNDDSMLNLTIISGEHERGDEPITELIDFKTGLSDIHEIDGQYVFMRVDEVMAPEVKPFNKIKGLVTAAYQTQLEEEWVQELRSNYTVEIDRKVLHSIR